jgi:hypothetical protein
MREGCIMVNKAGVTSGGNKVELQGLSTDTKPTNYGSGTTFYELDTGKGYVFDTVNINPDTNDGWWPVEV